jgi:predicted transglutaminase-like cysteine proteinase
MSNTQDTIQAMERLARLDRGHPALLGFVESVRVRARSEALREGRQVSRMDLLSALEDEIRQVVKYVPDPQEFEYVRSPAFLLMKDPRGDCDDHATLAKAAAIELGFSSPMFLRIGSGKGQDPYSHVLLAVSGDEIGIDGYAYLDSTVPRETLPTILRSNPIQFLHR